jgi:dolichol-phosphate mannosyltransferase
MTVNPQVRSPRQGPDHRLSIVIPLYNEEHGLDQLFGRLLEVLDGLDLAPEVICVDDGSLDGTAAACQRRATQDKRIKVVRLSRNFGHQAAISAGLDFAAGDAVVIMDGDLQDPPETIPHLLAEWRAGADVVYATRKTRPEAWPKRFAYWLFYRAIGRLADVQVPPDSGDFGLMDARVVHMLRQMPERNRFLRGLRSWVGLRQTSVPVDRGTRAAGDSKYTFAKLKGLAMDGLISFSYAPLKLATRTGFVVSAGSFLFAAAVIALRLWWSIAVPGWASLVVVVLFLGGIQLITIGILGEYVGRIYDEVKRRPLYIVAEMTNIDVRTSATRSGDSTGAERVERRL